MTYATCARCRPCTACCALRTRSALEFRVADAEDLVEAEAVDEQVFTPSTRPFWSARWWARASFTNVIVQWSRDTSYVRGGEVSRFSLP